MVEIFPDQRMTVATLDTGLEIRSEGDKIILHMDYFT